MTREREGVVLERGQGNEEECRQLEVGHGRRKRAGERRKWKESTLGVRGWKLSGEVIGPRGRLQGKPGKWMEGMATCEQERQGGRVMDGNRSGRTGELDK